MAIILLAVAIIIITLYYFVSTIKSRGGILSWNSASFNIGGIGLNKDSVFFSILPESLYIPLIAVSNYVAQGYYAFSLCMRLPWIPTFGLGGSLQIIDIITKHFVDIDSMTYQRRMEQFGWNARIRWHTIYTWFANDVSIYGVVLIMFVIGFCFALAYKDSLSGKNPFARIMVYFLVVTCLFIPCNSQILQSTYTLFSFITILICWLTTRRSYSKTGNVFTKRE